MIRPNTRLDETDQAIKNFENIKESLKGLYEILDINISQNDIYFKLASDNIVTAVGVWLQIQMKMELKKSREN